MPITFAYPTYTIGAWAAGVYDDFGCRWMVQPGHDVFDGPGVKQHTSPRPFGHGSYRATQYRDARTSSIQGTAECANRVAMLAAKDRFLSIFPDGETATLVLNDGVNSRQLGVELAAKQRVAIWPDSTGFDWQLSLYAADPRWLDSTIRTAGPITIGGPSTDGLDWANNGLDWASGGLDWGVSGTGGVFSLNNLGSAPTWPVFTLTGPLTNPTFTNPANGDVIAYTGTVATGQTLVFDTSPFTRSVALNGVDRMGFLASAQWIEIPPGGNVTVQFAGSGNGTVTATWQYAYN